MDPIIVENCQIIIKKYKSAGITTRICINAFEENIDIV